MRAILFGGLILGLAVAAALPSCGEAGEALVRGAASANGGESGIALDCPASGVLHGPWSLHFDETSIRVRWDACKKSPAAITVTPERGGASRTVEGEQTASEVLTSYDVVKTIAPDLPGTYYRTEVAVTGLAPSTCYRYELTAEKGRGGRFCTARTLGDPFVFLAIGDTNPAVGDTDGVLASVTDGKTFGQKPDFSVHLGDMQYYDSVFESYATWFPAMAPLFEAGALEPSVGNHELERAHEFEDYYKRLFGGAGFDGPVEYYRFESGGVWFFSLDTELELTPSSAQGTWLEAQLADAAAKPGFRFSVVYFHKPWITLAAYPHFPELRKHYLPSFQKYGVRLVLQGHIHGYERFIENGITYVVSGGGGAALHDLDASVATRPDEANARIFRAKRYHGTLFQVQTDRLDGRAIANDGSELDAFSIDLGK